MQSMSDLFWTGITLLLVMGTLSIVTTNWRLLKPPRLFNLCQETHPVPCSGLTPWQSVALLRVLVPGPGAPGLDHPRQVAAEGRDQDPGHQDLDQLPARGRQRPLAPHRPLCPGQWHILLPIVPAHIFAAMLMGLILSLLTSYVGDTVMYRRCPCRGWEWRGPVCPPQSPVWTVMAAIRPWSRPSPYRMMELQVMTYDLWPAKYAQRLDSL